MVAVLGGGGLVVINGMPCGNTGTEVKGMKHIPTPPGVSPAPNDPPGNEGTLVTGSKTVLFGGSSQSRTGSMVMSCNFPINLPTSVCLAVLIGAPEAVDFAAAATQAIRTKWVSDKLHGILKAKPSSRPLVPPEEIARFEAAQARQRAVETRARAASEAEVPPTDMAVSPVEHEAGAVDIRPFQAMAAARRAREPEAVAEATPLVELPMGPGPHAETMEMKRLARSAVAEAPSVTQPVMAAAARRAERESEPLRPAGVPAPLERRIRAGVVVGACLLALGLLLGGVIWNRRGPSAVVEIDAGASVVGTMSVKVPASAPSTPVVVSAAPSAGPDPTATPSVPTVVAPAASHRKVKPTAAPRVLPALPSHATTAVPKAPEPPPKIIE